MTPTNAGPLGAFGAGVGRAKGGKPGSGTAGVVACGGADAVAAFGFATGAAGGVTGSGGSVSFCPRRCGGRREGIAQRLPRRTQLPEIGRHGDSPRDHRTWREGRRQLRRQRVHLVLQH